MPDTPKTAHEKFAEELRRSVADNPAPKYTPFSTGETGTDIQEELRRKFEELFGPMDD